MSSGDGPLKLTECLANRGQERDIFQNCLTILGQIIRFAKPRFLNDEEVQEVKNLCQAMGDEYEKLAYMPYSVTPKMHLLVNHIPHYVEVNRTIALINEHGTEMTHAQQNNMGRRFARVTSLGLKLGTIFQQHTTQH